MERVTSRDGTPIAYDITGNGPALILVGGALSDRSGAAPLASLLQAHFTVIAYDRRGRGDSGDTAPYTIQREIEDLAALGAVAGGAPSLYGHSSGAVLALRAAAARLPVARLALYEPPLIVDDSRAPVPEDIVVQLTSLLAAGRPGDAVALFMTDAVGVPEQIVTQMRSAPSWPALVRNAPSLPYDNAIMGDMVSGRPLLPGQWAAVTLPVLVMDGGESPMWQHHGVRALVDALPNGQRRTLPGQTHGVDPAVLAPVLEEFFSA